MYVYKVTLFLYIRLLSMIIYFYIQRFFKFSKRLRYNEFAFLKTVNHLIISKFCSVFVVIFCKLF